MVMNTPPPGDASLLLSLPKRLLLHILKSAEGSGSRGALGSHADAPTGNELLQLRGVCRALRDAVDEALSWNKCWLRGPGERQSEMDLLAALAVLFLRGVSRWRSLRQLLLVNCHVSTSVNCHVSDTANCHVSSKLGSLQFALNLLGASCPGLQELVIDNAAAGTSRPSLSTGRCPASTSTSTSSSTGTTGTSTGSTSSISLRPLTQLRQLSSLEMLHLSVDCCADLPLLSSLSHLKLRSMKGEGRIHTAPSLQSLYIHNNIWPPAVTASLEPSPGLLSLDVLSLDVTTLHLPTTLTSLSLWRVRVAAAASAPVHLPSLSRLLLRKMHWDGPLAFNLPLSLSCLELCGWDDAETPPLSEPLDQKLPSLTNLTHLKLSRFRAIRHLPDLHHLSHLESLCLDKLPKLSRIPSLRGLSSLLRLHIAECPVASGLVVFEGLGQLSELHMSALPALSEPLDLRPLSSLVWLELGKLALVPPVLGGLENLGTVALDSARHFGWVSREAC